MCSRRRMLADCVALKCGCTDTLLPSVRLGYKRMRLSADVRLSCAHVCISACVNPCSCYPPRSATDSLSPPPRSPSCISQTTPSTSLTDPLQESRRHCNRPPCYPPSWRTYNDSAKPLWAINNYFTPLTCLLVCHSVCLHFRRDDCLSVYNLLSLSFFFVFFLSQFLFYCFALSLSLVVVLSLSLFSSLLSFSLTLFYPPTLPLSLSLSLFVFFSFSISFSLS